MNQMPGDRNFVRYDNVSADYLANRTLRRGAGWGLLWALGVGAVISGEYFGWNFGLAAGGFWGLAIATALMALMYICMVFCISELSAALPHAGGFYSFTRSAFGPLGGFVCGVTDAIEYVLTPAVVVVGVAGYLHDIWPAVSLWWWWLGCYALFVGVNICGIELNLRVGLFITCLAVLVLLIFAAGAVATGAFQPGLLFNVPADPGESSAWLPRGWSGVFSAIPFAIWFYLAIESLPLAAEETHTAARDVPRALIAGIFTMLALSILVLVFNSGVGGGAEAMGRAAAPMADGLKAVFGASLLARILIGLGLTGLLATMHASTYAYGRVLFALSRSGYFPRWISVTHRRTQTPYLALMVGGFAGLGCVALIDYSGGEKSGLGAALLYMAVFGAVISYILVMASYIRLRIARPDISRPYKSPLGIPGALIGGLLSVVALAACFSIPAYRPAVMGVAIFLGAAIAYFMVHSRHRLVAQAPEEQIALGAGSRDSLASPALVPVRSSQTPVGDPSPVPDQWTALRRFTPARIATGRAGGSLPTAELLRFGLDHAAARDAVHSELNLEALESALAPLGLPVVRVQTCASDQHTYLMHPDLGRRLEPQSRARLEQLKHEQARPPDLVIVVADGLSAIATQDHAPALLIELVRRMRTANLVLGPLVTARHARVALQDDVGQVLAAQSCLILLGERPGLTAADTLGAYFVFNPRPGNTDALRNCVSSIHPEGLPIPDAAQTLEYLICESLRRRLSGTSLKDDRRHSGLP
jgi:ethanolamine permease